MALGVTDFEIKPAYTERNGRMVRAGWHLLCQGEWCQSFSTRGQAILAMRTMINDDRFGASR